MYIYNFNDWYLRLLKCRCKINHLKVFTLTKVTIKQEKLFYGENYFLQIVEKQKEIISNFAA
jgi:hypothetical protein